MVPGEKFRDKLALVGSAVLVCIVGVAGFLIVENLKLSAAWAFFGLNAIGFVAVVGRKFYSQRRSGSFLFFMVVWLIVHSAVMLALTAWLPFLFWLPLLGIELFLGYLAAYQLFGGQRTENHRADQI